ncbi:hypothetical protein VOP03_13435 [Muricauda sp. SYSU M84420]|uniref:DNA binding HTH domain-containing protein n=1 Tax=Flagellimonas halotolerans TaxID=3112164 RepID=A0ABU6ITA5_9FLAO|nr:hypothetical protein [Muricauda sp. SYSU M84420]
MLENLNTYIEESKFKKEHIIKELGVSRATFYNKLKKNSFSVSEMVKLSALLFPEDVKAMEIKQALERSREDSAAGRVLEHKSVIADARKRVSR